MAGIQTRLLIMVGLYWTAEFAGVHWPQIRAGYPADESGKYRVSWIMRWQRTQAPEWLSFHALFASISFFLWLLLLSDRVRRYSLTLHKWMGRLSLILFVGSSWETPRKAWNMHIGNDFNRFIVMVLGILSLVYAVGAYLAIRSKNIPLHRQLAFRLVFCSAAFVIYGRFVLSILALCGVEEMKAKIYAIPYAAVTALGGMEVAAYRLERSYPPVGKTDTYRILGIPFLGLQRQQQPITKKLI